VFRERVEVRRFPRLRKEVQRKAMCTLIMEYDEMSTQKCFMCRATHTTIHKTHKLPRASK